MAPREHWREDPSGWSRVESGGPGLKASFALFPPSRTVRENEMAFIELTESTILTEL
jgi:hypothetical protein